MTDLERKQDRAPVPSSWDYAPAPEARDLVQLRDRYGHFVGGEWLEPRETYTTIDPSSEEALAEVGQATSEEVDLAVGRSARRVRERLVRHLAGRAGEVPLPDRAHPPGALAGVRRPRVPERRQADPRVARRRPSARRPRTSSTTRAGPTSSSTRFRTGSLGRWASSPRSYLGTSRCSWRLGRSHLTRDRQHRLLKPAEKTPFTATLFANLFLQAGSLPVSSTSLPATPDWRALVEHPGVDKIAFTGSTEVGKSTRASSTERQAATLELGGKAPNIVFADAYVDRAVKDHLIGIFFDQG